MNRSRFAPPDDLPVAGAWIPGYSARVGFSLVGLALTLVDFGVNGWLVLALALIIGAAMAPQQLYGWGLILLLGAGELERHSSHELSWHFLVLLAGLHLLYVLGALAPALPTRSWVVPGVFLTPLIRFLAIQVPTQVLAVVALLLLAPDGNGHRPVTAGAFAVVGVAGLAGLALVLLLGSGRREEAQAPSG